MLPKIDMKVTQEGLVTGSEFKEAVSPYLLFPFDIPSPQQDPSSNNRSIEGQKVNIPLVNVTEVENCLSNTWNQDGETVPIM